MSESEAVLTGAEIRRRMLGEAHVRDSSRENDPLMGQFSEFATELMWQRIWTRPGLDFKTKTMVCLVADVATGRDAELVFHLKMALQEGWTVEEVKEAILHLLGYVGAPLTREAFLVFQRVLDDAKASG